MSEKKVIKIKDKEDPIETEIDDLEDEASDSPAAVEEDNAPPAEAAEDIGEKLEAAEAEAATAYDRFLRVSAELENCKKRHQREISDFRKFANQAIITDMLPIIDNLERAIHSTENPTSENQCIVEGVELTHKEILKVLDRYGVKPVESIGQPFDPTYHEAVSQQPSDEHPDNTVLQELQRGYLLHERLIRPAMVVVSKGGASLQETLKDDSENEDPVDPTETEPG